MHRMKDKLGGHIHHYDDGPDNHTSTVGSDLWNAQNSTYRPAPSPPIGSFKGPNSAQSAAQAFNAQPNSHVPYAPAPASDKNYGAFASSAPEENVGNVGMYPNSQYTAQQPPPSGDSKIAESGEDEEVVLTGTQVLVTIPGAVVHLIDEEESVLLATGDFTLMRIVRIHAYQNSEVAVIAKVGEELKWPLVHDGPTVKLDSTHYFFSLEVPQGTDDSDLSPEEHSRSAETEMETLNYGVTFPTRSAHEDTARIRDLEYFLERFTMFSAPTAVQREADAREASKEEAEMVRTFSPQDSNVASTVIAEETVFGDEKGLVDNETSAAFWTTIAPNVDDYNSRLARKIASGTGHIVKDILLVGDSTVAKLDSGHSHLKSKFQPKREKSKISSTAIGGMRSVRKLSKMTDKVAGGVLGSILYTTGRMSHAVVKSRPGRAFFNSTPGQLALVSVDAFGTVFDAFEKAGRDVMVQSHDVTQDFVDYRYGESAKELADESLRSVGHAASLAWTVTKIHKAFNPKAFVKSSAKSAVGSNKNASAESTFHANRKALNEKAAPESTFHANQKASNKNTSDESTFHANQNA